MSHRHKASTQTKTQNSSLRSRSLGVKTRTYSLIASLRRTPSLAAHSLFIVIALLEEEIVDEAWKPGVNDEESERLCVRDNHLVA